MTTMCWISVNNLNIHLHLQCNIDLADKSPNCHYLLGFPALHKPDIGHRGSPYSNYCKCWNVNAIVKRYEIMLGTIGINSVHWCDAWGAPGFIQWIHSSVRIGQLYIWKVPWFLLVIFNSSLRICYLLYRD